MRSLTFRKLPLFIAVFVLMGAILMQSSVWAAPPKQEPTQKPSVVKGATLWAENCAPCHGATGKGDGPTAASLKFKPADFTDVEAAKTRTLAEVFTTIKEGRMDKMMPPWKNRLTDNEIWDVAAYAQNLSVTSADLSAGKTVYAENCATCHGADGVGDGIDLTQPTLLINKSSQDLFDELRAAQGDHAP